MELKIEYLLKRQIDRLLSIYNQKHSLVIIINENLHLRFIPLMIYVIFIINYIYCLLNEFKMRIFV